MTEKDEAKKAHSVAPRNNGIELGPVSAKQLNPLHDEVTSGCRYRGKTERWVNQQFPTEIDFVNLQTDMVF